MKKFAFAVVVIGLFVAAFATRPSPDSLRPYLTAQLDATPPGTGRPVPADRKLRGLASDISPDAYLQTVTYHDRLLWTTVDQDGKPQYVGAFSHWFKRRQ